MSVQKIYTGQPGASAAALYTSTNMRTTVTSATVTNPTAAAATLTIWLVASGDSAGDDNILYKALSVAAGGTVGLQFLVQQTLENGGAIHAQASSGTTLTMHLNGNAHT